MSLDIFAQDRANAVDYAARLSAPDLPAGFSDTFAADWNLGRYFGQSIAEQNTRMAVLSDIADDLYRRTRDAQFLKAGLTDEGLPDPTYHIGLLNAQIAAHRKADPTFTYRDLTEDDIAERMVRKSRAARREAADLANRERTWGGTFGAIAGSLSSQATDPINVVAAPLAAPESAGILAAALIWGGIAGGTQAANEFIGGGYRGLRHDALLVSIEILDPLVFHRNGLRMDGKPRLRSAERRVALCRGSFNGIRGFSMGSGPTAPESGS